MDKESVMNCVSIKEENISHVMQQVNFIIQSLQKFNHHFMNRC